VTPRNILLGAIAIVATIGVSLAAYHRSAEDSNSFPALDTNDERLVSAGKALYAENCAACHGKNLEGQLAWKQRKEDGRLPAPPHNKSGHTWHHSDRVIFELTKFGPAALVGNGYESDMPGFEGILDDQGIVAVLSFIKSTWPQDIQRRQHEITRSDKGG
tara:strand:+ start:7367 stop:7846 length:480 start_codon:yes stop_codon:yes gene_type:complete